MLANPDSATVRDFHERLLRWFAESHRPLPWRQSYEPYQVWIAEIMGQQTQMERVAEYFRRWLDQFPDAAAVAAAPEQAVLKAWEGLGYYSRARNIQRAAGQLVAHHGGEIPADRDQLLRLPGIGPYTAAAILSIAFNEPWPLVDANVERLFARLADIDRPLKQTATRKQIHALAETLLHRDQPRDHNQALMELGALVCTPRRPDCPACPVQDHCLALHRDTVEFRPLPTARDKRIDIVMACVVLCRDDRFFIQQRLADDIWGGLWEFPGGRLEEGETPTAAARREVAEETGWQVGPLEPLDTVIHHYTRYRVTLHGFVGQLPEGAGEAHLTAAQRSAWVTAAELADYPFPAGHRRLAERLRRDFSGKKEPLSPQEKKTVP